MNLTPGEPGDFDAFGAFEEIDSDTEPLDPDEPGKEEETGSKLARAAASEHFMREVEHVLAQAREGGPGTLEEITLHLEEVLEQFENNHEGLLDPENWAHGQYGYHASDEFQHGGEEQDEALRHAAQKGAEEICNLLYNAAYRAGYEAAHRVEGEDMPKLAQEVRNSMGLTPRPDSEWLREEALPRPTTEPQSRNGKPENPVMEEPAAPGETQGTEIQETEDLQSGPAAMVADPAPKPRTPQIPPAPPKTRSAENFKAPARKAATPRRRRAQHKTGTGAETRTMPKQAKKQARKAPAKSAGAKNEVSVAAMQAHLEQKEQEFASADAFIKRVAGAHRKKMNIGQFLNILSVEQQTRKREIESARIAVKFIQELNPSALTSMEGITRAQKAVATAETYGARRDRRKKVARKKAAAGTKKSARGGMKGPRLGNVVREFIEAQGGSATTEQLQAVAKAKGCTIPAGEAAFLERMHGLVLFKDGALKQNGANWSLS